jgi:hypothetical protein
MVFVFSEDVLSLNVLFEVAEAEISLAALVPDGVELVERTVEKPDHEIKYWESKAVWLSAAIASFIVGVVSVVVPSLALLALVLLAFFGPAALARRGF